MSVLHDHRRAFFGVLVKRFRPYFRQPNAVVLRAEPVSRVTALGDFAASGNPIERFAAGMRYG